jgi:hypothetical protein
LGCLVGQTLARKVEFRTTKDGSRVSGHVVTFRLLPHRGRSFYCPGVKTNFQTSTTEGTVRLATQSGDVYTLAEYDAMFRNMVLVPISSAMNAAS